MKIIIATPLYPPEIEAIATYSKELAQRLKKNHQVTVVAYADQAEKISGLNFFKINKHQPLLIRLWRYTILLWRLAAHTDFIYAQNAVASGLPAVIVKFFRSVPVIINFAEDEAWKRASYFGQTSQNLDEFLKNPQASLKIRLLLSLQGWVLRRASAIIVSSRALAELVSMAYKIPREKIKAIYPAPENTIALPWPTETKRHQLLVCDSLTAAQPLEILFRSIATLQDNYPDLMLIIKGQGPAKAKLQKLAQEIQIQKRLKFLGQISRAEAWYWRLSSSLGLSLMPGQNFSAEQWDNFRADLPIVAVANHINQELLGHQRGVLLPKIEDKILSEKIGSLLRDDSWRHALSQNVKGFLTEEFSWGKHLQRLNALLSSLKP